MGSRMFALLMAVAFTGGIIASPVAFAQGSGGQGGAGMGLRTQTMGPTQTAPSGSGPGKCRSSGHAAAAAVSRVANKGQAPAPDWRMAAKGVVVRVKAR